MKYDKTPSTHCEYKREKDWFSPRNSTESHQITSERDTLFTYLEVSKITALAHEAWDDAGLRWRRNTLKMWVDRPETQEDHACADIESQDPEAATYYNSPMEHTSRISISLLPSTKSFKVGNRLGYNISIQPHLNTTKRFTIRGNIKVDSFGNISRGGSTSKQVIKEAHLKLSLGYYGWSSGGKGRCAGEEGACW